MARSLPYEVMHVKICRAVTCVFPLQAGVLFLISLHISVRGYTRVQLSLLSPRGHRAHCVDLFTLHCAS